jgi:hypothetical protein
MMYHDDKTTKTTTTRISNLIRHEDPIVSLSSISSGIENDDDLATSNRSNRQRRPNNNSMNTQRNRDRRGETTNLDTTTERKRVHYSSSTKNRRGSFLRRYELPASVENVAAGSRPIVGNPFRAVGNTIRTSIITEKTPLIIKRVSNFFAPPPKAQLEKTLWHMDDVGRDHCDNDDNGSERRHVLKSRSIQNAVDEVVHDDQDRSTDEADDGNDEEQKQQKSISSTRGGWKAVKKHMKEGDFIVEDLLQRRDSSSDTADSGRVNNNINKSRDWLTVSVDNDRSGRPQNDTFFACTTTTKQNNTTGSGRSTGARSQYDDIPTVQQLRQKAIEQYQENLSFSPIACLVAIGVYLVISVLVFCLYLEPEWTVIDSCYFAVTTFTTLGAYFDASDMVVIGLATTLGCGFVFFISSHTLKRVL